MMKKMKKPLVSVVIPTYNRVELLERAVRSVLKQSYRKVEVIVVDDNTDKKKRAANKKLIRSLKDKRLRITNNKRKKGGGGARNTGIDMAKGEYIAFLDDDDIWLPYKLEKQIKVADKHGVIYCDYFLYDENEKQIKVVENRKKGDVYDDLLMSFCISETSTALINKEALDISGVFDESLPANQEYDLYIRIAEGFSFNYVPEALVKKYHYEQRVSSDFSKKTKGLVTFFKKHRIRFKDISLGNRIFIYMKYTLLFIFFSAGKLIGSRLHKLMYKLKKFK